MISCLNNLGEKNIMGSYNISCFVSGVTISQGDTIYFIPLKANKDFKTISGNFSFMSVDDIYLPAAVPIKGIYDDCGSFIPEKSLYTEILEKKFNLPIEKICDIETGCFHAGCYVHAEIYESMQIYRESWNGKLADHNDFNVKFNQWKKAITDEIKHHEKMIRLGKLTLRNYSLAGEEKEFAEEEIEKSEKSIKSFSFGYVPTAGIFEFNSTLHPRYSEFAMYRRDLYYGTLPTNEIINCMNFITNLYSISKTLQPSLMGEQCGNPYMTKKMLQIATKINNNKIKKD